MPTNDDARRNPAARASSENDFRQMENTTSPSVESISTYRERLKLPADCIEILCHGGFDQLITEACMLHLIREYEPYAEDCGTKGGDEQ